MATIDEVSALIREAVSAMGAEVEQNLNEIRSSIQQLQPQLVEPYLPVAIHPNVDNNNTSLHLIKSLPEFKGDATENPAWREAAHFAVNYYVEGSENYYIAMGILRNKISGSANVALSAFNTVLNFKAIIERLDHSYSDKRPIHVLENELCILRQGSLSILEFYNRVDKQLTLIVNKIKLSYNGKEFVGVLNDRSRENALRVFISGLRRPLCDILFSSKPKDLPSALAIAQELEFSHNRQEFAKVFAGRSKTDSQQHVNFQNVNKNIRSLNSNKTPDLQQHVNFQNVNKNIRSSNSNRIPNFFQPNNTRDTPVEMDVDPSSSVLKNFKVQPSNRFKNTNNSHVNPNQEQIRSLRHTPFSQQKFQTLNHMPAEADTDFEIEDRDSEYNNDILDDKKSNISEEEINFLD